MANKTRETANLVSITGISTLQSEFNFVNGPVQIGSAVTITAGGIVAGLSTITNFRATHINATGVGTFTGAIVGSAVTITSGGIVAGLTTVNYINATHVNISGVTTVSRLDVSDGKLLVTDENGGQPMLQVRNFATSATGSFSDNYGVEIRHASSGTQVHGALIHLAESLDNRRTLDISDATGTVASFVNGKVLIKSTTATGTASQPLQVTGGAYVSGSVGIGTTNPSTLLHIQSTDPTLRFKRSDASTDAYGELTADTSGLITLKSDPGGAAAGSGFIFTVDNTERVRINSSGNVGIGTNNPGYKLDVYSNSSSAYTTSSRNISHLGVYNPNTTSGAFAGIELAVDGVGNASIANISVIDAGNGSANLAIGLRNSNTFEEKVRINSSGNVGIGTINPISGRGTSGKVLTVNGAGVNSIISVQAIDGTNDRNAILELLSSGNGSSSAEIVFGNTDTTPGTNSPLIFSSYYNESTVERLRIDSSGRLGIGTNNPGATLNVVPTSTDIAGLFSGTTSSDMVRITQLGSGNALVVEDETNPDATPFVVRADGKVGINTTAMSTATGTQFGTARLNVYSNTAASVDSGVRGIAVGIAGSTRMGTALNFAFTGQQYFTQSGLDIMLGSGGYAFNIWDDNLLTRPRVMVNREGRVGINSIVLNNPNTDVYLSVVGDDSVPAAKFFRERVDDSAIVQFLNRSGQVVFQPLCNGNISVPLGNVIIGTSGKGIDFSATSDATGMTSELLDDYEEGTFTPSISGAGGPNINVSVCTYTKVGNLVTCNMKLSIRQNTATGNQTIIYLPYASTNTTNYAAVGNGYWSNSATGIVELMCRMTSNTTSLVPYRATAAATSLTQWQGADWQSASDTDWDFTITYRTD